MKHLTALVFVCFSWLIGLSQQDSSALFLKEFELVEPLSIRSSGVLTADSAIREMYISKDISSLLQSSTAINIRTYGSGSLASAGIRGIGANATKLTWNGVPINSASIGITDLSILPQFLFDDATVNLNVKEAETPFGSVAAHLSLKSFAASNQSKNRVFISAGSFGDFSSGAAIKVSKKNWQSTTRIFASTQENDFTYQNIAKAENPEERQTNAQRSQLAINHLSKIRLSKNSEAELGLLGVYNQRKIPKTIKAELGQEEQEDQQAIAYIKYRKNFRQKWRIRLMQSYQYNRLDYIDELKGIHSTLIENKYVTMPTVSWYAHRDLTLQVNLRMINERVENTGFQNSESRDRLESLLLANYRLQKLQLKANVGVLNVFNQQTEAIYRLSTAFAVLQNQVLNVFAAFDRDVNLPSMNDLYWEVGGNPLLTPEYSQKIEGGIHTQKQYQNLKVNASASVFYQALSNKLQWTPTNGGIWTASNIGDAFVRGMQLKATTHCALNSKWAIRFNYNLAYTLATDSTQQHLIYSPEIIQNSQLTLHYKTFLLQYIHRFTSERFVSSDNSTYLPQFSISSVALSSRFDMKKNKALHATFTVDNVFDTSYMQMLWRPMPGRSFQFNLSFLW